MIEALLQGLLAKSSRSITVQVDPARYFPNKVETASGDPSSLTSDLGWSPSIDLQERRCNRFWTRSAPDCATDRIITCGDDPEKFLFLCKRQMPRMATHGDGTEAGRLVMLFCGERADE